VHRITVVLIFILLLFALPAGADDAVASYAGRPLAESLRDLQGRGLKIIFSSVLVTPEMMVESEPQGDTDREILESLLTAHGLGCRPGIGGSLLVVRARLPGSGEVRGTVHDQSTGEPLANALVLVIDSAQHSTTAEDGSFHLQDVPAGDHTLEVRLSGYAIQRLERIGVVRGAVTEVAFHLTPMALSLGELIVTPSRYGLMEEEPVTRQSLSREEVSRMPHLGDDLNRALALLPGAASGDLSAGLNIRGGSPDEVLVLLDGLELYEPYHLKDFHGFFGIVDADAIGEVDYMTGGFPVEYGNRMSGVIDIASAGQGEPRTAFGSSFLHSRFFHAGRFNDDRGQWLLSARRGNVDLLQNLIDGNPKYGPSFFDLLGKMQHPLGSRNVLSVNLLYADDQLDYYTYDESGEILIDPFTGETFSFPVFEERVNTRYSSAHVWANLQTQWSPAVSSRTVLSLGRLDSNRTADKWEDNFTDEPFIYSLDYIQDYYLIDDQRTTDILGLRQDWSWALSDVQQLKWGFDFKQLSASYDYHQMVMSYDPLFSKGPRGFEVYTDATAEPSGTELGVYVADRVRFRPDLTMEAGLRWDRQTHIEDNDNQVSPRLNLLYSPGERNTFRLGWGHFHQAQRINEMQVEDGIDFFHPAQRTEQWLAGYEARLGQDLDLRVEAWRKKTSDPIPYFENLFDPYAFMAEIEPDRVVVAPERGRASGLELMLKQDGGRRLSWWASYTWSTAEDRIDDEWVPRRWDQRHAVSFVANYKRNEKWNFSLAGAWHTGWPTTAVAGVWSDDPWGEYLYEAEIGPRNGERLPAYHRLDFRATRTVRLERSTLRFYFELINAYGRQNRYGKTDIMISGDPGGTLSTSWDGRNGLPLIPCFGIIWETGPAAGRKRW